MHFIVIFVATSAVIESVYLRIFYITYSAKLAHRRAPAGPDSNTLPAVWAKPNEGIFVFLQTSCDVLTYLIY